jgi:hypothetical protein
VLKLKIKDIALEKRGISSENEGERERSEMNLMKGVESKIW